ncbi:hypothetical protein TrST_g14110 [Triparma strigata]|uniref:BTB domain-containing protein n=1 Tax=Triparma strigata TaxID=1606541 RepID=A0A9W7E3W6_9STRA|nr:hypothetical protein TrST_g14110 [Triparma strigata]
MPSPHYWQSCPLSVSSPLPPPRSGAASCLGGNNSRMYMFGGYGGSSRLSDLYYYTFKTETWTQVQCNNEEAWPGVRENNGVLVCTGSEVLVFGGYNGKEWLNDLWSLDMESHEWTLLSEEGPSCRFGYVSVVYKTGYYLLGGYDGDRWLNDFWRFDLETKVWKKIVSCDNGGAESEDIDTRFLPSIRSCPCWCMVDFHPLRKSSSSSSPESCMLLMGGYDGVNRMNDFYLYDFLRSEWLLMPVRSRQKPSQRYFHSCVYAPASHKGSNGKLFLISGYNGTDRLDDVWVYDLDSFTWCELVVDWEAGEKMGAMQSSYERGEREDEAGGAGVGQADDSSVSSVRPRDLERPPPFNYARPAGRSSLVAEYYRGYIYMFGGYNGTVVLNDFYKMKVNGWVEDSWKDVRDDFRKLMNDDQLQVQDVVEEEGVVDMSTKHRGNCIFRVEGRLVMANRGILGARSPYFKQMLFDSGMSESTDDSKVIEIPDTSYECFMKVMEYLYTGEVNDIGGDVVVELLITAELYMMVGLKNLCEDKIRDGVDTEGVASLLITSARHGAEGLKKIAMDFVLEHLEQVKATEGFRELVKEPDLLMEILMKTTMPRDGVGGGIGGGRGGVGGGGSGGDGVGGGGSKTAR